MQNGFDHNKVHLSVVIQKMVFPHQQMMTDVLKPLGMSLFPIWLSKLGMSAVEAGDRLYMDVSHDLASPVAGKIFVKNGLGSVDILIQKALYNVLKRKEYIKSLPRGKTTLGLGGGTPGQMVVGLFQAIKIYRENDAELGSYTLLVKRISSHSKKRLLRAQNASQISQISSSFTKSV